MSSSRVARWKIEALLAALFAVAAVVTAVFPEWIEALGFEPDNGDGTAEWVIVAVLGVAFLAFGAISSLHFLRQRSVAQAGADGRP